MFITSEHGWMRFEDYCNRTDRGARLYYTSSIISMEEELMFHELGERVVFEATRDDIDHWNALIELSYALYIQDTQRTTSVPNV